MRNGCYVGYDLDDDFGQAATADGDRRSFTGMDRRNNNIFCDL